MRNFSDYFLIHFYIMERNYKTKKEEMKKEKTAGNAVVFENPEFGKVLTLTDENGEPLFCAKDVCDILGYKKIL